MPELYHFYLKEKDILYIFSPGIRLKPSVVTQIQPGKLACLPFSNYSCYRPSLHKTREESNTGKLMPLKEKIDVQGLTE